jgi:hypothetical protein
MFKHYFFFLSQREDYEKFLIDRIRTVERLRDDLRDNHHHNNNNNSASPSADRSSLCMRGLEPFQNRTTHEDMHSKRKIHKSTIIIEQVRQAMLGIKDPERFRFLVAPQSDLASRRAQELAAMDELEVYPQRRQNDKDGNLRRSTMSLLSTTSSSGVGPSSVNIQQQHHRRLISHDSINIFSNQRHDGPFVGLTRSVASTSSLMPSMDLQQRNTNRHGQDTKFNHHNQSFGSASSTSSLSSLMNPSLTASSSLFSSNIRRLQEQNARRLMEIYNQPCGLSSSSHQSSSSSSAIMEGGGGNKGSDLFRFSLRRDSLLGSTTTAGMSVNDNNNGGNHQNQDGLDSVHRNGTQINSSNKHQQHLLQQQLHHHQQQQQQQNTGNMVSMMKMMPMATRFHIRRDSLSHLSPH